MGRWPLGSRPTRRSGMILLAAVASLYGILSTQNNLLYLVFAVLASLLAVGWAGPAIFSRGIRVARRLPPAVHEGIETTLRVSICNDGRTFRTPPLVIESLDRPDEPPLAALVEPLAPGSRSDFPVPLRFPRRGRWHLDPLALSTTFPLGLFQRSWSREAGAETLVYPRVYPVRDRLLEGLSVNLSKFTSQPDTEREVQALREFRDGDDPKRVNWKASARRDALVVGDYHRVERRPKVALYLDLAGGEAEDREDAIRMVASLAVFYHGRKRLIEMVTAREVITFGRSERKMKAMLSLLALLGPDDEVPLVRRPRTETGCLRVLVHSGRAPRWSKLCDLVMGPKDFTRYAPGLGGRGSREG